MKKIFTLFLNLAGLGIFSLLAQENTENNSGQITGNFQTDVQYYIEDQSIGAIAVKEYTLVNSWANFIYSNQNFSAGFRYEGYMNTLLGYPNSGGINDGIGIPFRWAMFSKDNIEITVGNFYEQFGNGLVLRSYEEKMLGIDNALDGFRIKYQLHKGINITGLIAKQRYYWNHGPGIIRGFDGTIQINEVFQSLEESSLRLNIGGSFVSKFQHEDHPLYNLPDNVAAMSGRIMIRYKNFDINSEYAYKINDPSLDNSYIFKPGQALLINTSYAKKGLGIVLATKWVDNMAFRSDRNASLTDLNINQLPEITKNHIYVLPAFYPYATQPNGEWGAKAEIMYKIPKNTLLGGKYGTNVSLNYSRAHDIKKTQINDTTPVFPPASGTYGYNTKFFSIGDNLYFQDINIEISKKWSKKILSNFSYVYLIYNYDVLRGITGHGNVYAHIGIVDMTYKFENYSALKTEIQHMFTKQDEGSWVLGMIEYSLPGWFFTVFDNWNYGNPESEKHYYSIGFGHFSGGTRIQLSYGKQRAGVMCIGGVCRNVPASNGVSVSISSTF